MNPYAYSPIKSTNIMKSNDHQISAEKPPIRSTSTGQPAEQMIVRVKPGDSFPNFQTNQHLETAYVKTGTQVPPPTVYRDDNNHVVPCASKDPTDQAEAAVYWN